MRSAASDSYGILGVFLAMVVLLPFLVAGPRSDDLRALWYAGTFLARGDLANVYALYGGPFTVSPPPGWEALMRARGETGPLHPYVYPPLWAALTAWLTDHVAFATVVRVTGAINAALLVGCAALAWRISGAPTRFAPYLLVATAVSAYSTVGFVALIENQAQILVSFLILLAIERTRRGADVAAGAALALAAAIKLYPLLFVPIWLVLRRWPAVGSFVATGLGLGLLSIALTGWPLHEMFLAQLGSIYGNLLVTSHSLSLPPLVGQLVVPSDIQRIAPAGIGTTHSWSVLALGEGWSTLLRAAPFVAALAAAAAFLPRLNARADPLAWPFAIGLVALFAPITWPYSYIPMFAFIPALIARLGPARGVGLVAVLLLPLCVMTQPFFRDLGPFFSPLQLYGTLSMAGFVAAFGLLALAPARG